jgi:uncharacterized membrane protein YqiK
MPDPTPTSGATPDPAATAGGGSEPDDTSSSSGATPDPDLGDAGKRVIAEARRATRAAEQRAAELETRLSAIEDRDKTELERARERSVKAETRVAELEHETRARTAAAAAGISDQWHRLRGSTEDELKADADSLAEAFGKRDEGSGLTPAELGAGPRPNAPAMGSQGMNQRIRRAAGR